MANVAVVGSQWGDEGKGKIVDLLAQDADLVCRYQGGPNAGHTIVVGDDTYKIRQIPSGIVAGKASAIGAGCVVDPAVLIAELDELEGRAIAEQLALSEANVRVLRHRSLAALRECMTLQLSYEAS